MVIGCDASGTIVEVGPGVTKFKVGDAVFGCTRLGKTGHGTFQDYVSMTSNGSSELYFESLNALPDQV